MNQQGISINLGASTSDTEPANGLLALVVAVVEILVSAMEREAVRRMESGRLTDQEIERLGTALQALDEEVARIKQEEGIEEDVDRLRTDLDEIIRRAIERQPAVQEVDESPGRPEPFEEQPR